MEIEDDHDKTPKWLTREYLENLLRLRFKDNKLRINDLSIAPATGKGEHYASVMVRTKINYILSNSNSETQTLSLIVKTTYEDPNINQSLEEYNLFDCEIMQFNKFLPAFHKLLSDFGDNTKLSADAFHIDSKTNTLFLEDLCALGYKNANRALGMDLVHAKMLISKIARYHAASVILHDQDKDIFKSFNKGIFNRESTAFNPVFEANMESAIEEISQWGPSYQAYVQKLIKLQKVFVEKATTLYDLKENDFHVLNHGDLWINNMMFLYKDDKPINVLLVDFQLPSWNSPVFDLIYFFNTSLQEEVRKTDQDELIQFYHQNLKETLHKLKYHGKIITLYELRLEFLKKQLCEFVFGCLIRPLMIEDERNIDLGTMLKPDSMESIEYRKYIYSKEVTKNIIKSVLPKLDKNGLFDY